LHQSPHEYVHHVVDMKLSDAEVAAVVTYIRNSWANAASPVLASDVARARQQRSRRTE
jgi:mono/diheme cytochrome c family protein